MDNRFKARISRMFSFGSCRTKNTSDVIEKAVFVHETRNSFQFIELSHSHKSRPRAPSICKPRCPGSAKTADHNSAMAAAPSRSIPRTKLSSSAHGQIPMPTFAAFHGSTRQDFGFYEKTKKKKKKRAGKSKRKRKEKRVASSKASLLASSSSLDSAYKFGGSGWWSSSEEEDRSRRKDETDTLFSSRSVSFSTDSHTSQSLRRRKKADPRRRRTGCKKGADESVKDSFAVVKSSSDPYKDFRTSMVEMIIEKQIFSAKELEQLLLCFLSLNPHQHHKVIIEVFTEICESLFPSWS